DTQVDDVVRSVFTPREFEQTQFRTLCEIREHLLRMSLNALILIVWANTELWRETKYLPGMEERELYIELSRKLYSAALQFRCFSLLTLVRINYWMVFRIRP